MDFLQDSESEGDNEKSKDSSTKCGICGDPHFYRDCNFVILTNKISNKEILSRARVSLPDMLEIKKLADESISVFSKSRVELGTEFGPFIAKRNLTLNPLVTFPIKLFIEKESDLSEYYLDTTDENECCWMMFVNPASDVEEQNLICYQVGEEVFFGSIRDIYPGEQLKVWYSPYYAFKMQKSTLSFKESSKLQIESEISRNDIDELNALIKMQQKIVPRVVWNCKFCYKLEKNVTEFAKHLMSHYKLHKRKTCEHCGQRFRYTLDYRKHVQLHCNGSSVKNDVATKLQVTKKDEQSSGTKPPIVLKSTTIGGPLLLQFFNGSLDNSNSLMQQPQVNSFEIEHYDNQNMLLDSDNLLNVDVIGNHSMKDLEDFNSDNKTKDSEKQDLVCDICLRKFTTLKAISLHLKIHTGKYFCSSCKKVFSRAEGLNHHRCNQIYSLKCPKCEKLFYQKKYLVKHVSIVHDKKFTCTGCKKFYYFSSELKSHVCEKVAKEKRRQFVCKLCPKKFLKEKYLNIHNVKFHSTVQESKKHICYPVQESKKYLCPYCSSIFTYRNYKRHLATVHNNKRQDCDCKICDKKFARRDTLIHHIRSIHMLGEPKLYKCTNCNKEVKTKKALTSHMVTHDDFKQYKCHCGVLFKYSRNLTKHIKKFHSTTKKIVAEDMHLCPICPTSVKLKRSLQRHIRQKHPSEYKDYLCVDLNAKKEQKKTIIQKCPICQYKAKSKLSLKRHIVENHPKETIERQKKDMKLYDEDCDNYIDTDQECMDLQKTIENMDFSIDTSNDNLLSGSETIDKFLKESSEQISIMFTDSPKVSNVNDTGTTVITDRISNREVFLSMPDLSEMELGNIVESTAIELQEEDTKVVVYVLKGKEYVK